MLPVNANTNRLCFGWRGRLEVASLESKLVHFDRSDFDFDLIFGKRQIFGESMLHVSSENLLSRER